MKKTIILSSAVLSILLSASIASAQSDSQYPASNFEPKVVFIDEAAVKHHPGAAAEQKSTASHAKKAEFDPQHPAAFFEPKVIFP